MHFENACVRREQHQQAAANRTCQKTKNSQLSPSDENCQCQPALATVFSLPLIQSLPLSLSDIARELRSRAGGCGSLCPPATPPAAS